jgi:hypothetical protein
MTELETEVKGLQNDRRMTDVAVKSVKEEMKQSLLGEMGEDMMDVLNGKKKVTLSKGDTEEAAAHAADGNSVRTAVTIPDGLRSRSPPREADQDR